MTTNYKVTELFCIIDEFCKHFDAENAGTRFPAQPVYPGFVLKSLAKENGVQFPKCSLSIISFW